MLHLKTKISSFDSYDYAVAPAVVATTKFFDTKLASLIEGSSAICF